MKDVLEFSLEAIGSDLVEEHQWLNPARRAAGLANGIRTDLESRQPDDGPIKLGELPT